MNCKYCGKEHNGEYGSGIFCSKHCYKAYIGSRPKKPKKDSPRSSKPGGWDCPVCGKVFRTRRLLKEHQKELNHKKDKSRECFEKINFECRFCHKKFLMKIRIFKTNHENHCKMNSNRLLYKGHRHSQKTKERLSEAAKKNNFGGWHGGKKYLYNGIRLDSSYEVAFAKNLDENKIKWERPKPFIWKLNNIEHRYYPDFFLVDYGVYVDTKNDYLINHVNPRFGITDLEKISLVEEQNDIKVFVLDKNNLSWSSISKMII